MSAGGTSGRSLRQLSTVAGVTAIVTLLVGSLFIWAGFVSLLEARTRVFETVGPARLSVQELRTAMLDQETGIRGYVITRDDRLLQPYTRGRADQADAAAEVRRVMAGDPSDEEVRSTLSGVETAMDDWRGREIAGYRIGAMRAGGA